MKKVEKVLISGNFNILHPGHLRLFVFAKELGNHLTVLVNSDNIAGSDAYVNEIYRLEALKSISYIDKAYIIKKNIKEEIIKNQSTNSTSIIKREILIKNNIKFDEKIKFGEDTLFLLDIFNLLFFRENNVHFIMSFPFFKLKAYKIPNKAPPI